MALTLKKQTNKIDEKWIEFDKDVSLLIRPLTDKAYSIAFQKYQRAVQAINSAITSGEIDIKQFINDASNDIDDVEIHAELFATHIIQDIKGVVDESGKEIEKSVENIKNLLLQHPKLYEFVIEHSANFTQEIKDQVEEIKKKS